jgi:hypothetical protein
VLRRPTLLLIVRHYQKQLLDQAKIVVEPLGFDWDRMPHEILQSVSAVISDWRVHSRTSCTFHRAATPRKPDGLVDQRA